MYGCFEEEKKRDIERALYVKMSTEEKGDLRGYEAGTGFVESTPHSLTPVQIRSSNHFILLMLSFLCVIIDLCVRQVPPDIDETKLTISRRLKMEPVLATAGESHQTETYTRCG